MQLCPGESGRVVQGGRRSTRGFEGRIVRVCRLATWDAWWGARNCTEANLSLQGSRSTGWQEAAVCGRE